MSDCQNCAAQTERVEQAAQEYAIGETAFYQTQRYCTDAFKAGIAWLTSQERQVSPELDGSSGAEDLDEKHSTKPYTPPSEKAFRIEKQDLSTCTTCQGAIDQDDRGLIVQDSKPYHGTCVAKADYCPKHVRVMERPILRNECEQCDDEMHPLAGSEDFYDPTPWCSGCKSMTRSGCKCGPIADNE